MSTFGQVLAATRRRRGFSRQAVADKIGKSQQFISALEIENAEGDAKRPSTATLRDLIYALAGDPRQGFPVQWSDAIALAFSGIGLEYQPEMPVSLAEEIDNQAQQAAQRSTTFWIVSDFLAESEDREIAHGTARRIVKDSARYRFFVPLLTDPDTWNRTIAYFRETEGMTDELLREGLAIYQVSECAFSARFRITDPLGTAPEGRYSFGGPDLAVARFYPIPQVLLVHTVRTYRNLLSMLGSRSRSTSGEPVGTPQTGFIKQVFPTQI